MLSAGRFDRVAYRLFLPRTLWNDVSPMRAAAGLTIMTTCQTAPTVVINEAAARLVNGRDRGAHQSQSATSKRRWASFRRAVALTQT